MTFPTVMTATQANKETPIGEMFTDLKPFALGAHDPANTSGLTLGVHGGPMMVDGVLTTIADQTTLLAAASTSYVEWTRAGVLSNNTTGFTAGRVPLYVATTSASGITALVDWRVWQALPGVIGRLGKSVAGSSDVTLTAAEARNDVLNFTGALTGSINVIVPVGPQWWTVTNNTSGAYTLTVKTAAGTGVLVPQGTAAELLADGTNVISSTSGAGAVTSVAGRVGAVTLAAADVTDFSEAVDDRVGALMIGANGVRVTYDDAGNVLTIDAAEPVNTQTGTSYTYVTGDRGKLVTHLNASAIAGTLPQAGSAGFPANWFFDVQNRGAGTLTITPTTSTIDGAASLALTTEQGCRVISDGTNYYTQRGIGGGGGSGTVTSVAASGGVQTASGSAITATGTIRGAHIINAQTGTSYAVVSGDRGKHVTLNNASAIAATIAQAGTTGFEDGYFVYLEAIGAGEVTLTPTTSTINGAATLVLDGGMSAIVFSDGANYRALVFDAAGVGVNAQTGTTYTYLSGDRRKLVTHTNASAIAGTLPQATGAFGANWFMWVQNRGAGTLTVTPTTSTIDGAASLALTTGQGCLVASDGTNYYTMRGIGGSGGSTQGKHAIFIAAGSMAPSVTGGCQALARIASAANQPDITSLDFDTTAQEFAQFYLTMPKSWNEGTVKFAPVWSHAATTTNFGVVWQLQGYAASDNDAIATAYGTAQTSTDTGGTTNNIYMGPESSQITIAGTPAAQDTVFFRVARNPSDGSDTLAIDASLMGIVLYITTDADTDA